MASDRKHGATRLPAPAPQQTSFEKTRNRKTVMKTLACLALLVGGWVSVATDPALAPVHSCLYVNQPPGSITGERPEHCGDPAAGLSSLCLRPLDTASWAAGRFLWPGDSAHPGTPVLLAASDDAQPVHTPVENPPVRQRAEAAPADGRVNAVRRERVWRRGSPRRSGARGRVARLHRPLAQRSLP